MDEPNSGWIHCSYKNEEDNRKEYLRAERKEGGGVSYMKEYTKKDGPTKDDVVNSLME